MARVNLKKMSLTELIALREQVQSAITDKVADERAALQKQIDALSGLDGGSSATIPGFGQKLRGRPPGKVKPGPRAGKKVAPKYRGPDGETWTGRGNAPRWLVALEGQGKKREGFLIA